MIQFDYPSGGIGRKERKRYTFSDFRGVDTSVAPINVDSSRAVESTNFVDRNGALHKRYGWEQVYQFNREINGFWDLQFENERCKICYAGTTFYRWNDEHGWQMLYTSGQLVSRRIACYLQGDRAYFVGCGDLLVYRPTSYENAHDPTSFYAMYRVIDDEDTFIPTTTAQILPKSVQETGLSGQYARDGVNLLTGWRKNTLVPYPIDEGEELVYELDGAMSADSKKYPVLSLTIRNEDGTIAGVEDYTIRSAVSVVATTTPSDSLFSEGCEVLLVGGEFFEIGGVERAENTLSVFEYGKWAIQGETSVGVLGYRWRRESIDSYKEKDDATIKLDRAYSLRAIREDGEDIGAILYRYDVTQADGSVGWITEEALSASYDFPYLEKVECSVALLTERNFFRIVERNGAIIVARRGYSIDNEQIKASLIGNALTVSKWSYIDKSLTADVTIKYYTDANYAIRNNLITAKYSTLYGVAGAADRLFVANGDNASLKNCILFSEMNDFTYFPDNFTKVIGDTSNEIQGFLRLANGEMAALKTESNREPTIYVFNGEWMTGYYDSNEKDPYMLPRFSTSGVSSSQGIIAPNACANLADDSLFLSKNGVYALELSQGTDSQRFAKERSMPINRLLKECNITDLKDACAIVYENKYYLAVTHYKQTSDKTVVQDKTYYEKVKDSYYLAFTPDEDKGMFRYYEREDCVYVADAHYSFTPKGAMADAPSYEWYPLTNIPARCWFVLDGILHFGTLDGRICRVSKDQYYDVEALFFSSDGTAKYNSPDPVSVIADSIDTDENGYLDTFCVNESADIQDGDTLAFLETTGWEAVIGGETYDEEYLKSKEFYVQAKHGENGFNGQFQLKTAIDGEIVQFNKGYGLLISIRKKQAVCAKRQMPTFDFGMPDYLKTIESFTITMNGTDGGYGLLDILTRNNRSRSENVKGQSQFGMLSGLGKTSFNVPFQNSYTRKCLIRNFNFAIFQVRNEEATDCSIASISVTYKYNQASGGVK